MRPLRPSGRARTRGAAMVEAVAVLPLVALLFVALTYFATAYAARLDTSSAARAAAWAHALGGCEGNDAWVRSEQSTLDAVHAQGADVPHGLDEYGDAAGGRSLVTRGSRTSVTVSRSLPGPLSLQLPSGTVTSSYQLACDERPQSGNPAGVLRYGWRSIRFW